MAKTETPVTVREPEGLPPSETVRISRIYPRWVKPLLLALAGTAAVGTVYGVYSWVRGFDPPPPKEPVPISTPYNGNHVVIPPVVGLETPTPTATPTAIPTNEQILERELFSLPAYAKNETDSIMVEVRADGKVTSEEMERVLNIVNDPLFLTVAKDDDLTLAFNLRRYASMFKELREAPYAQKLMDLITTVDARERVSEAWNYKVRREDDVFYVLIPTYQTFDGNSEGAWQFRWDNGSYHLKLWLDGNSILPLDNAGLNEWFRKRDDAEFAVMQMWVPEGMVWYDTSQWKIQLKPNTTYNPNFSTLRNNMDVIMGKKKINGLAQFKDLRDRIVRVRDDHGLKSYPWPGSWNTSDYKEGMFDWGRQTMNIPQLGLMKVPELYRTLVIPVLENSWEDFELVKLAYGLGMLDMKDLESSDILVNQVYQKALGNISFEQLGRSPVNTGDHQYAALVVPKRYIQQFPSGVLLYRGQSVSGYSMVEGLKADGVHYVRTPNGADIVWESQ